MNTRNTQHIETQTPGHTLVDETQLTTHTETQHTQRHNTHIDTDAGTNPGLIIRFSLYFYSIPTQNYKEKRIISPGLAGTHTDQRGVAVPDPLRARALPPPIFGFMMMIILIMCA